jgi:uncharacterized membrane protein
VILLYLRPSSWSLPLFLHVLGATVLFGATLAVTVLALAAWRKREHAALLSTLAFRTLLGLVLPAWILMRVGAQLIVDKEFPDNAPGWVNVGFAVSEPGLVLLVVTGILAGLAARRGGTGRAAGAVAVLAPIYLVALGVAWFAMSAKP